MILPFYYPHELKTYQHVLHNFEMSLWFSRNLFKTSGRDILLIGQIYNFKYHGYYDNAVIITVVDKSSCILQNSFALFFSQKVGNIK